MDAEGVEGVVILQFRLHQDTQVADDTGGDPHDQGGARLDKTGSRGDHDETGHHAGTEAEGGRFTGVNPLGEHPGKPRRCRRDGGGGEGQTGETARRIGSS